MSSLEVATASFASTPASGSLIATHKLNAERPEYRSFANIVYRKKTSIQFIGAVAYDSNTAVMPSHQVLDCIVVFAINTTGTTPPLVPANEGWTTLVSQDGTFWARPLPINLLLQILKLLAAGFFPTVRPSLFTETSETSTI